MATETILGQSRALIERLFESDDLVELRAFRADGADEGRYDRLTAGEIVSGKSDTWISSFNGERSVYFIVNPIARGPINGAATDKNIALARSVFVDFDDVPLEDALGRIQSAGLPSPSIVVLSRPNDGVHCYWAFKVPMLDLDRWSGFQRRLISLLRSDHKIKNPSRLMRLPGTWNHKRSGLSTLVDHPFVRYETVADLGIEPLAEERTSPSSTTPKLHASPDNLSRRTLLFLIHGAPEGERNARLFAAASDFKGNGIPFEEAASALGAVGIRIGLSHGEIDRAIANAYSRPRDPARRIEYGEDDVESVDIAELNSRTKPPPGLYPEEFSGPIIRPEFSNVSVAYSVDNKGRRHEWKVFKSVALIADELKTRIGPWPKKSGAGLFGLRENDKLWTISGPTDLFAYLHSITEPFWYAGNDTKTTREALRSPVTKQEFYEYLRANPFEEYSSVSDFPHHEPMQGIYYLPRALPESDGSALAEFLAALNPETELDRSLMLAALLTPGWGGPAGARPAFVFTSDYGRGSGKTETAKALGSVWGEAIPLDYEDSWQNVTKRIMSSSEWNSRVFLFDNIKGRFTGTAIESFVTAKRITGHRMFFGPASRLNDATLFVTFNLPEMSPDLADRSVVLKLGSPKHGVAFVSWAMKFVEEHRERILADLIAILQGPDKCEIPVSESDRWADWCFGVLAKFENGVDLLRLIKSRRSFVDSESDESSDIFSVLCEHLQATDRGEGVVEITLLELAILLANAQVFEVDRRKGKAANLRRCTHFVRSRLLWTGAFGPHPDRLRPRVDAYGRRTEGRTGDRTTLFVFDWARARAAAERRGIPIPPAHAYGITPPDWMSAENGDDTGPSLPI